MRPWLVVTHFHQKGASFSFSMQSKVISYKSTNIWLKIATINETEVSKLRWAATLWEYRVFIQLGVFTEQNHWGALLQVKIHQEGRFICTMLSVVLTVWTFKEPEGSADLCRFFDFHLWGRNVLRTEQKVLRTERKFLRTELNVLRTSKRFSEPAKGSQNRGKGSQNWAKDSQNQQRVLRTSKGFSEPAKGSQNRAKGSRNRAKGSQNS